MPAHHPLQPLQSALLRGQSLPIEVSAGTCLHVQRGHVRVTGVPQWFGGRLLMQEHELREGAVQLFEEAGWLLVDAVSGSQLCWRWPETRPSIWQRAFTVAVERLHRLRPAWRAL